jgi:hypothetical protein
LPTLLLLMGAGVLAVWKRGLAWLDGLALLVPPLGYLIIGLFSDINLGYRHLLPMLPFLVVFAVGVVGTRMNADERGFKKYALRTTQYGLVLWLALVTILQYPHYIPFFNVFAGGADGGWRYLVDSNLDWGQDLPALSRYQAENDTGEIYLSYFGESRPDYYGIEYQGLPSFPPRLMNPFAGIFYPPQPAPGIYAISATNLQGVLFQDKALMGYFHDLEPFAKVGYSIFLYKVPAFGDPINLLLSDIQVDDITSADYALLGTNEVQLRWFDPSEALIMPAFSNKKTYWAIRNNGQSPVNAIPNAPFTLETIAENDDYWLLAQTIAPELAEILTPSDQDILFRLGDSEIAFVGGQLAKPTLNAGEIMPAQTLWRQQANPAELKMFVHVVNETGDLVAQWDGLGIVPAGWYVGDVLIQRHEVVLPQDLAGGFYDVYVGLYNPDTNERYQTPEQLDRYLLGKVLVLE